MVCEAIGLTSNGESQLEGESERIHMVEIYDLDLGETYYPPTAVTGTNIIRVPGGWIFNVVTVISGQYDNQGQYMSDQYKTSSIFVPYNNEFRKTK